MMIVPHYKYVILGSGPTGLGCAFELLNRDVSGRDIVIIDKEKYCSGGLRNDCKMNFSSRVGFTDNWNDEQIDYYLEKVKQKLKPTIFPKNNIEIYQNRAEKLGCELASVEQTHLGTDGGLELIKQLYSELEQKGVTFLLGREIIQIRDSQVHFISKPGDLCLAPVKYDNLLIAPGRKGFHFLQDVLDSLKVPYIDNVVDIGIRLETRLEHYPIVEDYYDPKFYFQNHVRTFCTNSGRAHVVKEVYKDEADRIYHSVNGHAFSNKKEPNGLVNFAILKTVRLTAPLASGSKYAESLGLQASLLGGGKPIMQRVGDFRLGHRSKEETFNSDLYDFEPTLDATPGDISLAMPARILKDIWSAMKKLDTIIPGILHPSTIMYYPEIKFYANKPKFLDDSFRITENIWVAGDGAGTSRGITAAWASGIRVAEGMLNL